MLVFFVFVGILYWLLMMMCDVSIGRKKIDRWRGRERERDRDRQRQTESEKRRETE